jgi:hypothetical protein
MPRHWAIPICVFSRVSARHLHIRVPEDLRGHRYPSISITLLTALMSRLFILLTSPAAVEANTHCTAITCVYSLLCYIYLLIKLAH